jgi:hypothetical protein
MCTLHFTALVLRSKVNGTNFFLDNFNRSAFPNPDDTPFTMFINIKKDYSIRWLSSYKIAISYLVLIAKKYNMHVAAIGAYTALGDVV